MGAGIGAVDGSTPRGRSRPRSVVGRVGPVAVVVIAAVAVLSVRTDGVSAAPAGPTPISAQAAAAPSPGCVLDMSAAIGWWRGEGDLSGRIGPTLDGSTGFAPGIVGQGMVFGPGSRASTLALPVVASGVSVEAWVRPDPSEGSPQALLSRWTWVGGDSDDAFLLMLGPTGSLWWATDDVSTRSPLPVEASAPQLFDGQFHHVAATWDAVQTVVYVDGVAVLSRQSSGGLINPASGTRFGVGGSDGSGPTPFRGIIDEPSVHSRALSGAEIAAIHDAGAAGKCATWAPQVQISRSTGAAGDAFGAAVAVDGDTMVVGTYNEASQRGRARVYVRTGTTWSQQALLVASDSQLGDLFGWSVAVDGDTVVVGATGSAPGDPGAAYVFTRTGATWSQQAVLAPADGQDADEFGGSVAVSGDSALIGSSANDAPASNSGAAYVFARSGGSWSQQAKLTAPDGAADDRFGYSVGLDGTTALVGAFGHDTLAGPDAGAAYAFERIGGAWSQGSVILAPDGAESDLFGYSVAVSGSTAIVGAFLDDDAGDASGSAYVFQRSGPAWGLQSKLLAGDGTAADFFGWSVAIDGDRAIIGAMNDDAVALYAGSAYVAERSGSTWSTPTRIVGADTATEDSFGYAVAISSTTAVVGAPGADRPASGSGSTYVFVRR